MKKILEKLKSLFRFKKKAKENLNKIEEKQKNLKKILNEINNGDIIWAKRYKNEEEKQQILPDHREGPFIVLGKCDKGLICSHGTSVEQDKKCYLQFKAPRYNLHKQTYFKFRNLRIIDDYSFIQKLDELSKDDLKLCYNKAKVTAGTYDYEEDDVKLSLPVQIGDIVYYGRTYLIIDKSETSFYGLPIKNFKIDENTELEYISNLDYSSLTKIDYNNDFIFMYSLNNELLLKVLNKQKEYYKKINNTEPLSKGVVVIKNDNYYYIDGLEGQDLLVLKLFNNKFKDSDIVTINSKQYYTVYEQIKINKKDNLKAFDMATEDEIEKIKVQKKSYKKTHKDDDKKYYVKSYNIGEVILSKHYGYQFLIISICTNTYECIAIDDIKNGIYDPILIRKADARATDNSKLNEIGWFQVNKEFNPKSISKKENIHKILKFQREYNSSVEKGNK